jgi:succinoglycan biosynthesis transport protein ExoP
MSLQHFLAILRARWMIAASTLGIVVITALVLSLVLPKRYTATGKIMIDPRAADPVAGMMFNGQMPPSYIGTQVDILTSERVAQRVIKAIKLDENATLKEQWTEATKGQGSYMSWLADLLTLNLSVKQSRESNAIEVSYLAADPNFAAALTNAYMKAYIDTSIEMRVEPAKQYAAMFEEQTQTLRAKLEAAQARLSAYQQDKRLMATDERLDIESARLNELSSQLVMVQAAGYESSSRQAQANGNSDKMQEVLGNPLIAGVKADILRGESRLKELQSRFGDEHPQVMESRANLNELRVRLDQEVRRVTSGVGVSNTVNQSRESQIRSALEAQRQRVLALRAVRDQANVLVKDVDNAQRAFDNLTAKFNQSALESRANQTNITVLKEASPPVSHSYPKLWINLALALVLGTALACVAAVGIEMTDPRVRTDSQILGVRLLATIPDAIFDRVSKAHVALQLESTSQKLIGNS